MASSTQATSRRRFQPSLISTVKDSFRLPQKQQPQPGPAPELTPEPSPTEASPPLNRFPSPQEQRQQRRFAPQLIETSRRCRRSGDTSPATKPADKTDITPWANHIYAPKSRRKPEEDVGEEADDDEAEVADESSVTSSIASDGSFWVIEAEEEKRRQRLISRRESCTADGLFNEFEFVRKAYAKAQSTRTEEAILSAFPNYNPARYEGVEHFNHGRESSEDEQDHKKKSEAQPRVRRRRDSEVNWFAKQHQQHAEELQKARGEFEDKAYLSPTAYRSPTEELDLELGDSPPAAPIWIGRAAEKAPARSSPSLVRGPIGETYMPLIPETHITPFIPSKPITIRAPERKRSSSGIRPIGETFMPYIPSAPPGKAADMPFTSSPARQNIGFRNAGAAFNRVRVVTPPMAGQDLKFRRCESPQMTKMEPEYPLFPEYETNRDSTGQKGLWNGYCLAKHSEELMVPAELHGPHMLSTPSRRSPELSPTLNNGLCEEPPNISLHPLSTPEHRMKSGEPKGLHMLTGLSERLKTEKERAEREDLIMTEFGDDFVTQVYNYLSLGYPAMARDYDYELAKISGVPVWELRQGDDALMAKGHITMEVGDKATKCPRWRALKTYIFEWARQHPNISFDGPDPLHWGMRERRGSWAI